MTSPTWEEGGSAKKWRYSLSLFSKMGDKGEGEVKNLKKWLTSFMDGPFVGCYCQYHFGLSSLTVDIIPNFIFRYIMAGKIGM